MNNEPEELKAILAATHGEVKDFIARQAKAHDELTDQMKELRSRTLDLEQARSHRPYTGSEGGGGIAELADLIIKSSGAEAFGKKNTPSFSVEVPARMLTKNTIVSPLGTAQPLVASDRAEQRGVVFAPQQRLTIRGLFAQIPTDSNLIERPTEDSFTNSATEQGGPTSPEGPGEGELKAESSMTFSLQQTPVVTVAHYIVASRQILSDSPLLQRHLEARLIYGLTLKEETKMLLDAGSAGNMIGINTKATAFNGGSTNATRLDTLARGANQLAVGNYEPSAFILHPTDWLNCQLEKDSEGRYVLGDPGAATTPMLWGKPVVPTPSQTQGSFTVVDAARYGYVADRELANVRISENVNDAFIRNLIHVLCESRLALVTELGAAAVFGSLTYAG